MTSKPLILIVDDEESIRKFLISSLETKGYRCEETGTGDAALALVSSLLPDLVLLDLGLPDCDGKDVVAGIRKISHAPIVVISARDQEQEKVLALDAGADDYVTKPFGIEELVARVRVALRHKAHDDGISDDPVAFGALIWDPAARRVLLGGEEIHFSPVEYKLFCFMALHPGRILTHTTLLREVWGLSNLEMAHYVRVAVAALRKKLEVRSGTTKYIRTEIGTGYRFWE